LRERSPCACYLATYAFGSGEACLGRSHASDFQAGQGVAQYFVNLASEPHFTQRSGQ